MTTQTRRFEVRTELGFTLALGAITKHGTFLNWRADQGFIPHGIFYESVEDTLKISPTAHEIVFAAEHIDDITTTQDGENTPWTGGHRPKAGLSQEHAVPTPDEMLAAVDCGD